MTFPTHKADGISNCLQELRKSPTVSPLSGPAPVWHTIIFLSCSTSLSSLGLVFPFSELYCAFSYIHPYCLQILLICIPSVFFSARKSSSTLQSSSQHNFSRSFRHSITWPLDMVSSTYCMRGHTTLIHSFGLKWFSAMMSKCLGIWYRRVRD